MSVGICRGIAEDFGRGPGFTVMYAAACLLHLLIFGRPHLRAFSLKYLLLGAVSTGFLVFGLAWYFGITGPFIYNEPVVSHALAGQTAPAMYLALAMLLLGTAFKIGAVPMQLRIPDVYQGAPTPVTAFLSVASKVA